MEYLNLSLSLSPSLSLSLSIYLSDPIDFVTYWVIFL